MRKRDVIRSLKIMLGTLSFTFLIGIRNTLFLDQSLTEELRDWPAYILAGSFLSTFTLFLGRQDLDSIGQRVKRTVLGLLIGALLSFFLLPYFVKLLFSDIQTEQAITISWLFAVIMMVIAAWFMIVNMFTNTAKHRDKNIRSDNSV